MKTTLCIGDVRVAFAPAPGSDGIAPAWEAAHRRFLTDDPPDVALRVHRGRVPRRLDPAAALLDNDLWRLYPRSDGGAAVEARATPARDVDLWAVLEPGFAAGDVYLGLEAGEQPYELGYPLTQVLWTLLLGRGRGLTIHACGVDDRGCGLLFAGMSGAGKSTLARLWDGRDGVTVLSDDRMVLRRDENGRFWQYGTPWHGDAERAVPRRVPLARAYILEHGKGENRSAPLSPAVAAAELTVRATPPVWDRDGIAFTLDFLQGVVAETPCARLSFLPAGEAVDFVRAREIV